MTGCRMGRRFAVLLLLALWLPAGAAALAQDDGPPAVERPDAAVFDEAWRLVQRNFFDPDLQGVDWQQARLEHRPAAEAARSPAELSAAINAMLGELRTSHTAHYGPDDIAYYHLLDIFSGGRTMRSAIARLFPGDAGVHYDGVGAFFASEGGRIFVTGVWAGTSAAAAGLQVGDEIVAADGAPFHPIRSFRGKAGRTVVLRIRSRRDGPLRDLPVQVERIRPAEALLDAMAASVRTFERDGVTIGYIRIWSYAGDRYQNLLIREMATGGLSDADALIIDLRGGWGGASPAYLDPFLPGPSMTVQGRGEEPEPVAFKWRRPVALLVDEGTRSGKEVLTYGFRAYDLGPVIGERTAGALVAGRAYLLSDDSLLYLAVADVHVDGMRLEGRGVAPDVEVAFDPAYAAGADPQLDRAIAELAGEGG